MKKRLLKGIKIVGIVFGVLLIGGFIYLNISTYEASEEAVDLLEHEQVSSYPDFYVVMPIYEEIGTVVYYQGGLVDTVSYLPFALKLANEGVRVILMKMPLNLAILDQDAFLNIDEQFISGPVLLAGHSLGGASASLFLQDHASLIDGLVMLASYPAGSADLSNAPFKVLSIRASLDGVMDVTTYEECKALLPEDTHYDVIDGGNHAQFGDYGVQRGDQKASISRNEQQNQLVALMVSFLESFGQ